ncbi:MAG: SAM-dependent methyltransferase, partial [Lachnospiraceae bacterium]|nr:SAM-dependent methyltransferase [Lachnospiraceae bacterium]
LAMALKREEYPQTYSLPPDNPDLVRYLKCETLGQENQVADGYVLVCVGDYPLGWAKCGGGRMKNKYLPGWRMQ